MSLEDPNKLEKFIAWPYWKVTLAGIGVLVLIGAIAGAIAWFDDWRFERSTKKKKQEIANTAREIANTNAQIGNLLIKQGELRGKLERDTEDLQRNIYGLEDAKVATNQALGNLDRALNTNSNVNRSVADLDDVLRRLDQ